MKIISYGFIINKISISRPRGEGKANTPVIRTYKRMEFRSSSRICANQYRIIWSINLDVMVIRSLEFDSRFLNISQCTFFRPSQIAHSF